MAILVITVDLNCCRCKEKLNKILSSLKWKYCIEKIEHDEKDDKVVVVRGNFCPEKIRKVIWCKAGNFVKDIVVVEVWPRPPPPPPVKKPVTPPAPSVAAPPPPITTAAPAGPTAPTAGSKKKVTPPPPPPPPAKPECELVPWPYPLPYPVPWGCPLQSHCCPKPPPPKPKPKPCGCSHERGHCACVCKPTPPCARGCSGSHCVCGGAVNPWPPQPIYIYPPPWGGCNQQGHL
ncbi:hypothetical protein ABZP36_002765 [Zizania latifolia]